MNSFQQFALAIGSAWLIASYVSAEPHEHGHHHQQEAHLHGYAELTLALEGDLLEINLESPAANIVGFEHRARTQQQVEAVKKAKSVLEAPAELFFFSGTQCSVRKATADFSALSQQDEHEHGYEEEKHSEVAASYSFRCPQAAQLKSITVKLHDRFPGIETLKAMWVTDKGQGSKELTPDSNMIRIR